MKKGKSQKRNLAIAISFSPDVLYSLQLLQVFHAKFSEGVRLLSFLLVLLDFSPSVECLHHKGITVMTLTVKPAGGVEKGTDPFFCWDLESGTH